VQSNNADALNYVLNTRYGGALLHRVRTLKGKDDPPMQDTILSIMKSGGIVATCAQIVQKGTTTISEHEIVAAVTKIAAERYLDMSPAQAFAKVYTDQGAEGRSLREAINVAKAMPFVMDDTPLQVGGEDAQADNPAKAVAQLRQIGRDRWPSASEAQQFANAMTDPRNTAIAAKAHRRPSPTTSFAFPR
jgi:hypothetical protein